MKMRFVVGACALAFLAPASQADESVISDMEKPNWGFYGDVTGSQVEAEGVPGGSMLRINVRSKGRNYWDSAANSEPLRGFEEGQIVTLGFFARAAEGQEGAWVNANVAEIAAPYDAAVISRINLTERATFYCLEGVTDFSAGNGETRVTLHIGGEKQKIDLGPFLVTVRNPEDGPSQLPCQQIIPSW